VRVLIFLPWWAPSPWVFWLGLFCRRQPTPRSLFPPRSLAQFFLSQNFFFNHVEVTAFFLCRAPTPEKPCSFPLSVLPLFLGVVPLPLLLFVSEIPTFHRFFSGGLAGESPFCFGLAATCPLFWHFFLCVLVPPTCADSFFFPVDRGFAGSFFSAPPHAPAPPPRCGTQGKVSWFSPSLHFVPN